MYFAWGETVGYANGSGHVFNEANYTAGNINTNLDLAHDAAHVNMGGNWRMPTADEFQELIDNTTRAWTTNYEGTGVAGYIVSSKTNSNQIFMPAAGYCDGSSLGNFGSSGHYWSSKRNLDVPTYKDRLFFYDDGYTNDFSMDSDDCYLGYSVRGVCE